MFKVITSKFTEFICNNDGKSLASLFTKNGVYHDYIYGNFQGKEEINKMLSDKFHRDGENFFWEMYDHAIENELGYAKYRFGFTSKIPEYKGKKVSIPGIGFFKFTSKIPEYKGKKVSIPGIGFFQFKDGLIKSYSESVNGGLAMVQLGVNPFKMEKVFIKWLKRSFQDDPNLNI